ncbi:nonstructural protein [wheat yellows virus]|nr:nonstructural protein [wheat yellows virus]WBU98204.1 nonstructural protein [wheat yellows virus]WBU98211.1 nonstructural protein [wheat yellows virus]WBU98218.1 nonstructural protein [wheat yellows virus]WBU98225.1 nonstructural protein [wheat yellows virus]
MNLYTSALGHLEYDHSLLVKNDIKSINLTCEDTHCSARVLCYVYDIHSSRHPSVDEHQFLRLLHAPDDADSLGIFLRSLVWILSNDKSLPEEFRLPIIMMVSGFVKFYTEVRPRPPTTNCWTCRMSRDNLPFPVDNVKGFPTDAELYIVPISDHDGKPVQFSNRKSLYRSPSKKKHQYVISSDKPPISGRYTPYVE